MNKINNDDNSAVVFVLIGAMGTIGLGVVAAFALCSGLADGHWSYVNLSEMVDLSYDWMLFQDACGYTRDNFVQTNHLISSVAAAILVLPIAFMWTRLWTAMYGQKKK